MAARKMKDPNEDWKVNGSLSNGYNTFTDSSITDAKYTIQEAIDCLGFGRYQFKVAALISLGLVAEGMSFSVMAVLAPVLKCEFFLTGTQEALLTTSFFIGMIVSSSAWGVLCDKYGRRITLFLFTLMTGYFGVLTALSPSYAWLIILRFLVGFGLSAAPQFITHCAEFLPTQSRGRILLGVGMFWVFGGLLEVVIAMVVSPTLGWRWLMVFTGAPFLLFPVFYKCLPESPHYYIALGQYEKAESVLKSVAKQNGRDLPMGSLRGPLVKNVEKGQIKDLFVPKYRRTTVLLCFMWISWNVCYYGTGLLTSALFENYDGCHGYDSNGKPVVNYTYSCEVACTTMTFSDYMDFLITSLGDIGSCPCCMLLMPILGRKKLVALLSFAYAVVLAACNFCVPRNVLIPLLFIARVTSAASFDAGIVYTAEVFPTAVRATGTGLCAMASRLGLLLMPFFAQVLIQLSAYIAISFYAVLGLLGALAAIFLPIETENREMQTTVEETPN